MSRAAKQARCRHCRSDIWVGPDSHVAALTALVDIHPLTRTGELLAVCAGRRVYHLDINHHLWHRSAWRLPSPARGRVLAEHRCGDPIPATWRQPSPTRTPTTNNTQEVPF
jgi:hypothetical protein